MLTPAKPAALIAAMRWASRRSGGACSGEDAIARRESILAMLEPKAAVSDWCGTVGSMRVNDVEICVDTTGRPGDPAILLIGGAASSMDWWPEGLLARLADGGRYVIRYDTRDTGQSESYPPGEPGYTMSDLLADAVGVLDALRVPSAQVVGVSMGGAAAQLIAAAGCQSVIGTTSTRCESA